MRPGEPFSTGGWVMKSHLVPPVLIVLFPFLHDNAPALVVAQIERHNRDGLGRLLVGSLDFAQVVGAVSQDGDAPGSQLGSLWSLMPFSVRGTCSNR